MTTDVIPTLRGRVLRPPGALRRAIGRQDGMLITGFCLIGLVMLASLIGHFVLVGPDKQNLLGTLKGPSLAHPFGTDDLGRDVLSRTLAATWLDLGFAVGVTILAVLVGLLVGTAAGYIGGWVEKIVMRVVDAAIAFPYLVLVLAVIAIVGTGMKGLIIGAVASGWAIYARFSRAEMLVLREKQFVQAAQTLGYSPRRVMFRHALPNLVRPVTVYSMSDVVFNILTISGLSFLGLGVPPPTPEWGAIINGGQQYLLQAWWISTLPGLVVVIVGLGFVLIGDSMSERLGITQETLI